MMAGGGLNLWVWMIIIGTVAAYLVPEEKKQLMVEERKQFRPFNKARRVITSEDFKNGVPDVVSNMGGLFSLITIDYDQPPKEVIKNVGDALIPLIATGLALFPGGALIGGLLTGVWGVVSLFFGEPSKSPMELAIEDIKKDLTDLKKYVNNLAEELPKSMKEETNAMLSNMVHRAINAEITRNKYVCNKYAIISRDFIEDIKNKRIIDESRRIEITSSIHDCDNFLRDTADAFVFKEFADILWIPSVYATLLRTSFLSEISSHGASLKLDGAMIDMFKEEIKADMRRHFEFSMTGVRERMKILSVTSSITKHGPQVKDFLPAEYEACKIQGQLIYIDREIYPYGVPKQFVIFDSEAELDIDTLNVTGNENPYHIQIFHNETDELFTKKHEAILNCIMGPTLIRFPDFKLSFRVNYVPNKSYQLRVLYFIKTITYRRRARNKWSKNWTLVIGLESSNGTIASLNYVQPNETLPRHYLWKAAYHEMYCKYRPVSGKYVPTCRPRAHAHTGTFVIENYATYNILSEEETKGRITIKVNDRMVAIFGAELIVHPIVNTDIPPIVNTNMSIVNANVTPIVNTHGPPIVNPNPGRR